MLCFVKKNGSAESLGPASYCLGYQTEQKKSTEKHARTG